MPSGLWVFAGSRADRGEFKNWDCGNLMASHCSPASHTQPNNAQEYHEGLKGWRKAVVLGDCLILFPPVPPPLPPILFHSWPYRQSDTSMASRVPGRFGLESQVSSAYGSLEGAVGSPGEHISRLGDAISCFRKDCPVRVPAPRFFFQHAFPHRDVFLL